MKIEKNKGFLIREQVEKNQMGHGNAKNKKKSASIFAANLNMGEDPITKKRKEAQQKAMKVITDTFAGEQKIDNDLKDRSNHIDELRKGIKVAKDEIDELKQEKENLKEQYQITDESQEEKDLKLLEKREKMGVALTKEEREHLREMDEAGLTEYQKRSLELSKALEPILGEVEKAKKEIMVENAIVKGINQERLKSSPMVQADQEAEIIMDAASDEIIGMLIQEAKDHLDEEQKKKEEEAEKLEAEKEKEEEFIEEVKEKIEEMEELTDPEEADKSSEQEKIDQILEEEVIKLTNKKTNVQLEIERIADKMNLIIEDIKGAVVDSKK